MIKKLELENLTNNECRALGIINKINEIVGYINEKEKQSGIIFKTFDDNEYISKEYLVKELESRNFNYLSEEQRANIIMEIRVLINNLK